MAAPAPICPDPVNTILMWIGFDNMLKRASIIDDAFEDCEDLSRIRDSDIHDLVHTFAKHSGASKIIFGPCCTKHHKSLIHWVQDFCHCSKVPAIEDSDQDSFLAVSTTVAECQELHDTQSDQQDALS